MRAISKHDVELAQAVVDAGALAGLVACLNGPDPTVKAGGAEALGHIASHDVLQAQAVADANAVPGLIACLSHPELHLRRAAAVALCDLAKHSVDLAQAVSAGGALAPMARFLVADDARLRRAAANALAAIAKHNVELAEAVVATGAVSTLLSVVLDSDASVRKAAATAVRELVKHTAELAKLVVGAGGAAALVEFVRISSAAATGAVGSSLGVLGGDLRSTARTTTVAASVLVGTQPTIRPASINSSNASGPVPPNVRFPQASGSPVAATPQQHTLASTTSSLRGDADACGTGAVLPGVVAIGYLSAFSETTALAVIIAGGVPALLAALLSEPQDHVRAATVWALCQIGRHTAEHARALADAGALPVFVALLARPDASEDLLHKAKRALKAIVSKCGDAASLAPLLRDDNAKAQKYALLRYAALLPHDAATRKAFMQAGLLQRVQEIKAVLVAAATAVAPDLAPLVAMPVPATQPAQPTSGSASLVGSRKGVVPAANLGNPAAVVPSPATGAVQVLRFQSCPRSKIIHYLCKATAQRPCQHLWPGT